MKAKEWAILERQVLGVIRLTLSRSVAQNDVKEKTTANLMKALFGMYEKPSTNNKVHLMKKLFKLKMAENTSVAQHLNEFSNITKGKGNDKNSNQGRSKSKISNRNRSKSRSGQQVQCWNYGKMGHFRRQCKSPKKKNKNDSTNAVTEEVQDALLLVVDSSLDDSVWDSGTSFHTTPHQEIIQNYAASDFGKVYLTNSTALDVVGIGDVCILLPNGSV